MSELAKLFILSLLPQDQPIQQANQILVAILQILHSPAPSSNPTNNLA